MLEFPLAGEMVIQGAVVDAVHLPDDLTDIFLTPPSGPISSPLNSFVSSSNGVSVTCWQEIAIMESAKKTVVIFLSFIFSVSLLNSSLFHNS